MFNTSNLPADYAKKSFAAMYTRLFPGGTAPLLAMTAALPKVTALQNVHGYWSKTMVYPTFTVGAGGQLVGDTTFTGVSTTNIIPGTILLNPATRENILVISVVSATQITVRRAVGTVVAAAIAANQQLVSIGNMFEQGSSLPTSLAITPTLVTNNTQIVRNAWSASGTNKALEVVVGGKIDAENKLDAAAFHGADQEKIILFGQKYSGTLNNQPIFGADGLVNTVTTLAPGNVTTAGATTNYTQLEGMLDPCFNQVTDAKIAPERVLFVGSGALRVLHQIGRLSGTYQIMGDDTKYGLQFTRIKFSRGDFLLKEHPLLNTNSTWSKMAIAVDLSTFRLAYLAGRDTKYDEYNTQGQLTMNGVDACGGVFTSEFTVEIRNPAANAVIYNLTAGAAG